jgi:hypothetical protein
VRPDSLGQEQTNGRSSGIADNRGGLRRLSTSSSVAIHDAFVATL